MPIQLLPSWEKEKVSCHLQNKNSDVLNLQYFTSLGKISEKSP